MNIIAVFNNYNKLFILKNSFNNVVVANIHDWPIVQDEVRGYYEVNTINQTCKRITKPSSYYRLALIVESPHKSEFDLVFNPIVPLNSKATRNRVNNEICNLLLNWFKGINCIIAVEVYIMNPIQHQTSLYHFLNNQIPYNLINIQNYKYTKINSTLRNNIWKWLYYNCNLENLFINRLNSYHPDYIVNCCTGTCQKTYNTVLTNMGQFVASKHDLKECVRKTVFAQNSLNNSLYVEYRHPSVW